MFFNTKQIILYICSNKKLITMKKYKVIKPFFKLSEKKNYEIGDEIELSPEGFIPLAEYVVSPKTIDEVDKEIKKANKKLK